MKQMTAQFVSEYFLAFAVVERSQQDIHYLGGAFVGHVAVMFVVSQHG